MIDPKSTAAPPCSADNEKAPADLRGLKEASGGGPPREPEYGMGQPGAPDCFQAGDILVQVAFREDGEPLEHKLKAYFLRLKG